MFLLILPSCCYPGSRDAFPKSDSDPRVPHPHTRIPPQGLSHSLSDARTPKSLLSRWLRWGGAPSSPRTGASPPPVPLPKTPGRLCHGFGERPRQWGPRGGDSGMPRVAKQAWDGLGDASTQPRQAQAPRGTRGGNKPRQRLGFARLLTRQAGFPEQQPSRSEPSGAGNAPPPARRLKEPPALCSLRPEPCGRSGYCWPGHCCIPLPASSATRPAPAASCASPTGMPRSGCRRCTACPARSIPSTASSGAAWTSSSKTRCPQVSSEPGSRDPAGAGSSHPEGLRGSPGVQEEDSASVPVLLLPQEG